MANCGLTAALRYLGRKTDTAIGNEFVFRMLPYPLNILTWLLKLASHNIVPCGCDPSQGMNITNVALLFCLAHHKGRYDALRGL